MWCDNCHCENFESLEVVSVKRRLIDEYYVEHVQYEISILTEVVSVKRRLIDEYYVEHVQYEISILTIKCKECGHIFTEVY